MKDYYNQLLTCFYNEVKKLLPEEAQFKSEVKRIIKKYKTADPANDLSNWKNFWQDYMRLTHAKAEALNRRSDVARSYPTMHSFWNDVEKVDRGESPYTYWDTYEHGRRRQLERLLAQSCGSESALLLNSGMSALAVALGSTNLTSGDVVITGKQGYFETTEYLNDFIERQGIKLARVDTSNETEFINALREHQPKVVLVDTVINSPNVAPLVIPSEISEACPHTLFIIDNTVQSYLTQWFHILSSKNVLVVESATKYLTSECMAGVIYGSHELVGLARAFARSTGQQLQEKAFNYLNEGDILLVKQRLKIHSRNIRLFIHELQSFSHYFDYIRPLDYSAAEDSALFESGVGCLLFMKLKQNTKISHSELIDKWNEELKKHSLSIPVKAGFGWHMSTARAYESTKLNQPDAPDYLRISLGLESTDIIKIYAQTIVNAIPKNSL